MLAGRAADATSMDQELNAIEKQLTRLDRSEIKNWLKRGELLSQARATIGTDDGFRVWCKQIKIAKTTAYKCMAAFRNFGTVPTSGQFSKSAMDILAQSAEAREDAIDLSKHKRITARIARELLSDYLEPTVQIASKENLQRVTEVAGGFVIVKSDRPLTDADFLAMLIQATKAAQEAVKLSRAA